MGRPDALTPGRPGTEAAGTDLERELKQGSAAGSCRRESGSAIIQFDGHTERHIQFKARQLSRRSDFSPSDEDDLRQELWVYLLARIHHFDPERGSLRTFVSRVVNSAVATILRNRKRYKRTIGQTVQSLDSTTLETDGEMLTAAQAVSPDDLQRRIGTNPRDRAELDEDVEAVHAALVRMPEPLQRVARQLMSDEDASVSRECGLTRRQVGLAKQGIQEVLEQTGFEEI